MKERNVMFTETDFKVLDSCESMLGGLATYLGDGYGIILHSLHDLDHSVIKIINGHCTDRREGFPITDLALSMLAKIEERSGTNCIIYFNRDQKDAPLKSATIVTHSHSHIAINLLCINLYTDTSVFQFLQNVTPPATQTPDSPVEKSYVKNVDELVVQAVTEVNQKVQNDSAISNANKNGETVSTLYQRGIFSLKDAVVKVASLMNISRNTVYMHVRNPNHS